jgi:MFS family permease
MRDLLRHRDFRLLLIGQTLSMFGDTAMLLTLGMWAKDLTGSNAAAGSVFAVLGLPTLIAPFGGVIIDRFRRRQVMIAVDLATAAAVLLLLLVHDRGDLWLIYLVALLYGGSLILFGSARSAFLHTMLDEDQLGQANGSLSTVREALRLVGPAAGAGLYAWLGGGAAATLDAATFLISAAALFLIRTPEAKPERTEHESMRGQVAVGIRHLWSTPVLRATVVVTVICMLAIGLSESVYFAVIDEGLHKPVTFLGLLQVAMGIGAITGGVTITSLIKRTGELKPVSVGLGLVAAGSALSMIPSVWVVAFAMALLGAGLPVTIVCLTTLLQRRTPAAIQGRVFTTFETVTGVPQVTSIAIGAALVAFVDFRVLLSVMAAGIGISAVYAALRLREDGVPLAGELGATADVTGAAGAAVHGDVPGQPGVPDVEVPVVDTDVPVGVRVVDPTP